MIDIHPTLRTMVRTADRPVKEILLALQSVSVAAFGDAPAFLAPVDRYARLQLYLLANLIEQVMLLDDMDVFQAGHRCPDQLERYCAALEKAITIADGDTIRKRDVEAARILYERLRQVQLQVSFYYRGLS